MNPDSNNWSIQSRSNMHGPAIVSDKYSTHLEQCRKFFQLQSGDDGRFVPG
jgi:hypothetical protein